MIMGAITSFTAVTLRRPRAPEQAERSEAVANGAIDARPSKGDGPAVHPSRLASLAPQDDG
jgi:hypothetical protein